MVFKKTPILQVRDREKYLYEITEAKLVVGARKRVKFRLQNLPHGGKGQI